MNQYLEATINKFDAVSADKFGWEFHPIYAVFRAQYASALTTDRVVGVAVALHGKVFVDEGRMGRTLTTLVRAGVLRSRVVGGRRLYEVNY